MQPNPKELMHRIDLDIIPIGFYDAPDSKPFEPVITPEKGICLFDF
jgi:hypothetical protein